ncbi:hypothetical protein C8F01DRAFT_1085940 [Mycena amicta]|nr:hypothetical protein C8F01DRAFT_1085940 [Mycena amicta]
MSQVSQLQPEVVPPPDAAPPHEVASPAVAQPPIESMRAEDLESFFWISQESLSFPRVNKPASSTETTKRMLSVANAIAYICVSEPSHDIFAAGISVNPNEIVIFLAGNEAVPSATVEYLREVFRALSDIADKHEQPRSSALNDAFVPLLTRTAFARPILQHMWPKYFDSLTKRDSTWHDRVNSIRRLFADTGTMSVFETINDHLDIIHKIARAFCSDNDPVHLDRLWRCLELCDAYVRGSENKTIVAAALEAIDRDVADAYDLSDTGLDDDTDVAAEGQLKAGFSMARFIDRVLAPARHIQRLLRLPISSTYWELFRKDVQIEICSSESIAANIDAPALIERLGLEDNIFNGLKQGPIEQQPHAELQIFQRLLEKHLLEHKTPFWVIGASKLMCVGCHTYVGEGWRRVVRDLDPRHTLKPMCFQGCHGKTYPGWVPADLSDFDEILGCDVNAKIRKHTANILDEKLKEYVEQRRRSDSSVSSATSETLYSDTIWEEMRAMNSYYASWVIGEGVNNGNA